MDSERFDRPTKTLSTSSTRRRLLRLLAAVSVAGGVLTLLAPDDVLAGKGRNGRHGGKDSNGGKGGHARGHKGKKGPPGSTSNPCSGVTCTRDVCHEKPNGTPCGPDGSPSHCCQGGVCIPPLTCLSVGKTCGSKADCDRDCCSQKGGALDGCNDGSSSCICGNSLPGQPCGSDDDCFADVSKTRCVCGTCCCTECGSGAMRYLLLHMSPAP